MSLVHVKVSAAAKEPAMAVTADWYAPANSARYYPPANAAPANAPDADAGPHDAAAQAVACMAMPVTPEVYLLKQTRWQFGAERRQGRCRNSDRSCVGCSGLRKQTEECNCQYSGKSGVSFHSLLLGYRPGCICALSRTRSCAPRYFAIPARNFSIRAISTHVGSYPAAAK